MFTRNVRLPGEGMYIMEFYKYPGVVQFGCRGTVYN